MRWPWSRKQDRLTVLGPRRGGGFSVDVPPEIIAGMTGGGALAPRVSRSEALQVPAVLRSRNLICSTLARLPLRAIDPKLADAQGYLMNGNIDPDVANVVLLAETYEDLLFESVAWWRVTRWGWHNYPVEAIHVPFNSVHVAPSGSLAPSRMMVTPDQPFPADGRVYIDGIYVPDDEIIRFDSPNPPLLRHAARAIRTCLKLDRTAAMYADQPTPLGMLEEDDEYGGADLTDDEIQKMLDDWNDAINKNAWAYMRGVKPTPLQWDAEKIQLAAQRQHAVLEIARAAGVDPEDLGVSTTSRTYANAETRRLDLLDFTLSAYVAAVEQRLSMRDVLPRGYEAKVAMEGFLRSDTMTRYQTYKVGLEVGAVTHEEIRELERRPALTPAQMPKPPAPPTPPTSDQPMDDQMEPAHKEPDMAFAADSGTAITFDTDEVAASFRVNPEKRTISGLVVPWGKVARSGFSKWRFTDTSLWWSDPGRVKLNLHHDHTQAIARAVRLDPTTGGLDSTFKVARGPEGDRALELAEDGVLDGFSIEVDFEDGAWVPDPEDESVRLVVRAQLRGVALTAMPAFDDARVDAVAASMDKQKGASMPDVKADGESPQADLTTFDTAMTALADRVVESHKALTAGLTESIGESVSAGVKAALEDISAPQGGPQSVRAARYSVTREAPIYTFNGQGHSLVRDAWYAGREHEGDAIERLRKYRMQTEEVAKLASSQAFATVTTGTASQVIPPGYRPDLYVNQLQQGRPLVAACSQGIIANATPFTVPVFTSITGATADHVEGTNPTDGTLAFGTKTVTPGGISGKMVLTREIVDASNPAIDQIALAGMRESYARQTEGKVYTLLNGANGAGGTITTGFVPSGAQASTYAVAANAFLAGIRKELARYDFNRFASPSIALMGQTATQNIAGAVGSDGRPLFPWVGVGNMNPFGAGSPAGWVIDGVLFAKAWANTGVAAGDSQIMILNSSDAWVWESPTLTFRFEEKSGPANIELALFGYFATHLLRPVGLSGIRLT